MFDRERLLELLNAAKPGHTLPQAFYGDPEVYQFDVSSVFCAVGLCWDLKPSYQLRVLIYP
jgi:hypothetical protein